MSHNLVLYSADADDRFNLSFILKQHNFTVRKAYCAADIGQALVEGFPDIFMIDVFEGGTKICCAIKSDPKYAHIPVILYSGGRHFNCLDPTDYDNLKKNTFADYVFPKHKIGMTELKNVFNSLLKVKE